MLMMNLGMNWLNLGLNFILYIASMAPRRWSHPPRPTDEAGPSSDATRESYSPVGEDDTLDIPSRDDEVPDPSEGPDDYGSEVPTVALPRQRSRGLDPNRIDELTIVDGRYGNRIFNIFGQFHFVFIKYIIKCFSRFCRLEPSNLVSQWSTYTTTNQPDHQASEFRLASPETRARWFEAWRVRFQIFKLYI